MHTNNKTNIIGFDIDDLRELCKANNFPEFHGNQIFKWLYEKRITNFFSMTDIPERLRKLLQKRFYIYHLKEKREKVSKDGLTIKYDFLLEDKREIESVFLKDENGRITFCISTQIGCPVGCIYCATGKMGLKRNLTAGEIINQIITISKIKSKPNNIVFMGMGEPLLNFENLVKSIKILNQTGMGHRRITVSTCGIIKGIYNLADTGLDVKLAVSLGSAIDKKRKGLIPYARTHSIDELLKALIYYKNKTKRRITIEYTLIKDINDTREDVLALTEFAKKIRAHVNIIRYNPIKGINLFKPDSKIVERFKKTLIKSGLKVTERYRRGNDIKAACGQLVTKG